MKNKYLVTDYGVVSNTQKLQTAALQSVFDGSDKSIMIINKQG